MHLKQKKFSSLLPWRTRGGSCRRLMQLERSQCFSSSTFSFSTFKHLSPVFSISSCFGTFVSMCSLFRSKAIVTYTTRMQKQTPCCLELEWSSSLWCYCGIQRLNTLCLADKVSSTLDDLSLMFLWLCILIFRSSHTAFIEKSAWHVNRGHIENLTIGIDD